MMAEAVGDRWKAAQLEDNGEVLGGGEVVDPEGEKVEGDV
jgi:hypothetical protein